MGMQQSDELKEVITGCIRTIRSFKISMLNIPGLSWIIKKGMTCIFGWQTMHTVPFQVTIPYFLIVAHWNSFNDAKK